MNWSSPTDPDAPQAATVAAWVRAFEGITHRDGRDLAEVLTDVAKHRPVVLSLTEPALQAIGERILNMQTLIEQNAAVRADGSELVMARVQSEAVGALRAPGAQTGRMRSSEPNLSSLPSSAAEKIAAARAEREARGEPDRDNDRNAVEANPLGGDR